MSDRTSSGEAPAKRTDVGYKRPPVEGQFKKGQKPPPRKKRQRAELCPRDILWMILQEQRRVMIDGVAKWMRVSEILMKNAYLLADKGSPTIERLLCDLLMTVGNAPDASEGDIRVFFDDDPNAHTGVVTRRV